MSKYEIRFECQNRILNSKYEIRSPFECQNILNVKIRNSVPVRMSKKDFECQNTNSVSNVKIGF